MNPEEVKIYKGEHLSEALKRKGYPCIPSNAIIDKTLPGLGATYMEISIEISKRNSIIIEPNVPVIIGKEKDNKDVLAVWEKCTKAQIKKYLQRTDIPFKKILTTPEGYVKKIRPIAIELFGESVFYSTYFCLFDECEKITQDVDYRKTISQPINDFLEFKDKAFVSATPLSMSHPIVNSTFKRYKVVPQYDYKKDINLIVTNSFEEEATSKLQEMSKSQCVCVFLNTTDGINKIVNSLDCVKSDYKIFCAKDSTKKLKELGFDTTYENLDYPLAKYNFFTCRFFSALDIELDIKPDIVILTSLDDAKHSMIDPFTESIQIYGRFRDTYCKGELPFNSLTHISNWDERIEVKTENEIKEEISEFEITYKYLQQRLDEEGLSNIRKQAITKDLESVKYSELLDENCNINYFSVDNLYNDQRVRSYYTDTIALKQAYEKTQHFNVNFQLIHWLIGNDDILRAKKGKTFKDRCVSVIFLLSKIYEAIDTDEIERGKQDLRLIQDAELIIEAYDILGQKFIEESAYKQATIKKQLDKTKIELKRLSNGVFERIRSEFQLEGRYTTTEIIEKLTRIYKLNGIDEFKIFGTTLNHYFLTGTSDSKIIPKQFYIDWEKFKLPMHLVRKLQDEMQFTS